MMDVFLRKHPPVCWPRLGKFWREPGAKKRERHGNDGLQQPLSLEKWNAFPERSGEAAGTAGMRLDASPWGTGHWAPDA